MPAFKHPSKRVLYLVTHLNSGRFNAAIHFQAVLLVKKDAKTGIWPRLPKVILKLCGPSKLSKPSSQGTRPHLDFLFLSEAARKWQKLTACHPLHRSPASEVSRGMGSIAKQQKRVVFSWDVGSCCYVLEHTVWYLHILKWTAHPWSLCCRWSDSAQDCRPTSLEPGQRPWYIKLVKPYLVMVTLGKHEAKGRKPTVSHFVCNVVCSFSLAALLISSFRTQPSMIALKVIRVGVIP